MKHTRLMRERVRRVTVLFRELGLELTDVEYTDDSFTAGFETESGFDAGIFIDHDSKFLEIAFTFAFSPALSDFVKDRVDDMLRVCYEYGCYMTLQSSRQEITFSTYTKIYYAGLNYFALKETLRDFSATVESLHEVLEPAKGVSHGDS